jgi:murein DD-endopeptidase MepM/ murein hydrolase activator NlpD
MPLAGDELVDDRRTRPESLAERLEGERREREEADRRRREWIERRRAARERAIRERLEQRRRERLERLRRERRARAATGIPARRVRVAPAVEGPVRKRRRTAENRRREAARRRGLFWPTAKAGLAASVVLGLSAALGSLIGLPVPGLDAGAGRTSLAESASLLGVDPGTPPGLSDGYVFPILGAHDFGDAQARFGASRSGHVHEGQDVFAKAGAPEVAVHDGVVVDRGTEGGRLSGGRGNYVAIYDPEDDHSFVYMHMRKPPPVEPGDRVRAGQVIGQLGCSGSCEGPHLHFELRIGKATLRSHTRAVDPLPYLRQWPQSTPAS